MNTSTAPRFGLSAAAVRRVGEILAANPDQALRVAVLAGGCSGFQYRFELEPAVVGEDDLLIEESGARVLVDHASLDLLAGAELDFADSLMGAHFSVRNPNATSSCGCGTSFSVD